MIELLKYSISNGFSLQNSQVNDFIFYPSKTSFYRSTKKCNLPKKLVALEIHIYRLRNNTIGVEKPCFYRVRLTKNKQGHVYFYIRENAVLLRDIKCIKQPCYSSLHQRHVSRLFFMCLIHFSESKIHFLTCSITFWLSFLLFDIYNTVALLQRQ